MCSIEAATDIPVPQGDRFAQRAAPPGDAPRVPERFTARAGAIYREILVKRGKIPHWQLHDHEYFIPGEDNSSYRYTKSSR
jgi:hypothetical protein